MATKITTKLQEIDRSLPKVCKVSLVAINGLKGYVVLCLLYNPSKQIVSSGSLSQCMVYPYLLALQTLVIVCSNSLMKKTRKILSENVWSCLNL